MNILLKGPVELDPQDAGNELEIEGHVLDALPPDTFCVECFLRAAATGGAVVPE